MRRQFGDCIWGCICKGAFGRWQFERGVSKKTCEVIHWIEGGGNWNGNAIWGEASRTSHLGGGVRGIWGLGLTSGVILRLVFGRLCRGSRKFSSRRQYGFPIALLIHHSLMKVLSRKCFHAGSCERIAFLQKGFLFIDGIPMMCSFVVFALSLLLRHQCCLRGGGCPSWIY